MNDRGNAPGTPPIKTPNWSVWNGRHKATVFQAVCLALNIHATTKSASAVKGKVNDGRAKLLRTHVNTVLQWLDEGGELRPIDPHATRNAECYIGLPEFIAWLDRGRLVGVTPPPELLALNPPNPRANSRPDATPRTANMMAGAAEVGAVERNPPSTAERLLPGLLIAYIRGLANGKAAPPLSLVTEKGKIKAAALATAIEGEAQFRKSQKTKASSHKSGLSAESLRKAIGVALDDFNRDVAEPD